MILFITVTSALLLDLILGEPRRFHPLVGFGNLASSLERQLNTQGLRQKKLLTIATGTIAVIILVAPITIAIFALSFTLQNNWVLNVLILYWAIGHQSLRRHIQQVIKALNSSDLSSSRTKLAMIVSRDTDRLNQTQIAQATIETTLENGSDAIFAAIFWFCLCGAPGVVVYRLSNTLDAMWGYRSERYLYFGRCAARLDDALNYIPARLVALSYALLGNTSAALKCWREQAPLLSSPNAGPVMAAGAGSLGLMLGGPTYYHGSLTSKPFFGGNTRPTPSHINDALKLIKDTVILWCSVLALIGIARFFL